MSFRARALVLGSAAHAALHAGGTATVFAAFERSFYVETRDGIACIGGPGLGRGPLNVSISGFEVLKVGSRITIDCDAAPVWTPKRPEKLPELFALDFPLQPAKPFIQWLSTDNPKPPHAADALIGMGGGLTPAGDDFVGGAMIALRSFGFGMEADRIAAWALPLARTRTNRISRAYLECAARGEGHEYLHDFLLSFEKHHLERLARIGHTSGLDAAAGALAALRQVTSRRRPLRPRARPGGTRSASARPGQRASRRARAP